MKFFNKVLRRLSVSREVVPQAPSQGQLHESKNRRRHELQELLTLNELLVEEHCPRSPLSLLRNASVTAKTKTTFDITIPIVSDDAAEEFLQCLEHEMQFMIDKSAADKAGVILSRRFAARSGNPVYWFGSADSLRKTRSIGVVRRETKRAERTRRSRRTSKAG